MGVVGASADPYDVSLGAADAPQPKRQREPPQDTAETTADEPQRKRAHTEHYFSRSPTRLVLLERWADTCFPNEPLDTFPGVRNNFVKGVRWAPDSSCLLASSDDCKLRVLVPTRWRAEDAPVEAPRASLEVAVGGSVYDFAWFPTMRSSEPASCVFSCCSNGHPLALYDAFTGALRASYLSFDGAERLLTPLSTCFTCSGDRMIAGFNASIRVFDVARPGRDSSVFDLTQHVYRGRKRITDGQRGIISSLDHCAAAPKLFAAGGYAGELYLYSLNDGTRVTSMFCGRGGVSQVKFAPSGQVIFASERLTGRILCWDVRKPTRPVAIFKRQCSNNQRVYFDIDAATGQHLTSGSQDGRLYFFNLANTPDPDTWEIAPSSSLDVCADQQSTVNGVSLSPFFSPSYPFVAVSTGHRTYPLPYDLDASSSDDEPAGASSSASPTTSVAAGTGPHAITTYNSVQLWAVAGVSSDDSSSPS